MLCRERELLRMLCREREQANQRKPDDNDDKQNNLS